MSIYALNPIVHNQLLKDPTGAEGQYSSLPSNHGALSFSMAYIAFPVGDWGGMYQRRWKERFPGMKRVMHKADVQGYGDTRNIEVRGCFAWTAFFSCLEPLSPLTAPCPCHTLRLVEKASLAGVLPAFEPAIVDPLFEGVHD